MFERFRGTRSPTTDFAAVRSDMQSTPLYYDVDLSVARSLTNATHLDLPINGNVIYIDQKGSSGFATLHFNDDAVKGNTPFTVFPGFVARVPYTKLIVENGAQPGMTMRIIYGVDIDFQPAVSAGVFGEVSVVDGAKARTLLNNAFTAAWNEGATAGQYAHVQLYNPPASGVRTIIEQILIGSSLADQVRLLQYDTPLTNTQANSSKLIGGATSLTVTRRETNAVQLGSPIVGIFYVGASLTAIWPMREPIVLRPGRGILLQSQTVNTNLSPTWEYFEEPNV